MPAMCSRLSNDTLEMKFFSARAALPGNPQLECSYWMSPARPDLLDQAY